MKTLKLKTVSLNLLLGPILSFFLISSLLLSLMGCTAALVGGGAAGGYYLGKDKRSVDQIAKDASITTEINANYVKDDLVKVFDINVDTYQGVVTLRGYVEGKKVANRAIYLAKNTPGVTNVVSKLVIETN